MLFNNLKSSAQKGLLGLIVTSGLFAGQNEFKAIKNEISLYNLIASEINYKPNSFKTVIHCNDNGKTLSYIKKRTEVSYFLPKRALVDFKNCNSPITFFFNSDNKGDAKSVSYFFDSDLGFEKTYNINIKSDGFSMERIPGRLETVLKTEENKVVEMNLQSRKMKIKVNYDSNRIKSLDLIKNGKKSSYHFNSSNDNFEKNYDPYKDGI